jgi:hypothetical protein
MKKVFTLLLVIALKSTLFSQKIDISGLPAAIYNEKYGSLDRWGTKVGNIIKVELKTDSLGELTFSPSLIEIIPEKGKETYILFPSSGTETDIYIYQLNEYSSNTIDAKDSVLKKNIIMCGDDDLKRAIRIDDLAPGFYYVSYISCSYGGCYILRIKEKKIP